MPEWFGLAGVFEVGFDFLEVAGADLGAGDFLAAVVAWVF